MAEKLASVVFIKKGTIVLGTKAVEMVTGKWAYVQAWKVIYFHTYVICVWMCGEIVEMAEFHVLRPCNSCPVSLIILHVNL